AARVALSLAGWQRSQAFLDCGGAGVKTNPLALRCGHLSEAVNDDLLSRLRNTLRRQHGIPRGGEPGGTGRERVPCLEVTVLWIARPSILPEAWTQSRAESEATSAPQGLSCAGYGSAVMVTASMGLRAADEAVHWLLHGKHRALPT